MEFYHWPRYLGYRDDLLLPPGGRVRNIRMRLYSFEPQGFCGVGFDALSPCVQCEWILTPSQGGQLSQLGEDEMGDCPEHGITSFYQFLSRFSSIHSSSDITGVLPCCMPAAPDRGCLFMGNTPPASSAGKVWPVLRARPSFPAGGFLPQPELSFV